MDPFEGLYLMFTPRMKPVQRAVYCLTTKSRNESLSKRIVCTNIKLFIIVQQLHVGTNFYDLLSSVKHKRRNFEELPVALFHAVTIVSTRTHTFMLQKEQKSKIKLIHMTCTVSRDFWSHIMALRKERTKI